MEHMDQIVLADGNFPAASKAKRLVRCDGHRVPELLDAILNFLHLSILQVFFASSKLK
jgi:L-fucose mutarotase